MSARDHQAQRPIDEDGRLAPIVVVESDVSVGRGLVEQLRADGYRAVLAHTAEHARVLVRGQPIRAIVLGELDAPRGALDLLEEIRGSGAPDALATSASEHDSYEWEEWLPAVMIGQGNGRLELLRAFELGVDDFLVRTVTDSSGAEREGPDYLELRARLRAVLRRAETRFDRRLIRVGSLEIDTDAHLVSVAGVRVELCRLEYELLVQLASKPTGVCSKQELLRTVWRQRTIVGARTVDSHASRLRRKLEAAGAPGLVVNVRGVGYRLV
jgi:DNA-binding response OmpR family regulator